MLGNAIDFGGTTRLIYGEMRNGRYVPLWDSPAFYGWFLEMGYRDLDRDGTEEILLSSRVGQLNDYSVMLSALKVTGEEITRQTKCFTDDIWGFDEHGGLCPIVGKEIQIDGSAPGPDQILVTDRPEDAFTPYKGRRVRYRFIDGRYRAVVDQPGKRRQPAGG